ncbi:MAG: exodeoxyribonuclease V subunit gamma, partial [Actinomycetes bacterium]
MLSVTVADRPEELLDLLVEHLRTPSEPPLDVFDRDWVGVANLGMRNWVTYGLARRLGAADGQADGVMANIDTPLPGSLRWRVLDAWRLSESNGQPDTEDPWSVARLTWTLLELMIERADGVDPALSTPPEGGTLAARAQAIAELFDRYAIHRPAMVQSWLAGDHPEGGDGQPLHPSAMWQCDLYRAAHRRISDRHPGVDAPVQRFAEALSWLRSDDSAMSASGDAFLPPRLAMVGVSSLTAEVGPLLEALAVHRQVRLLMVTPSTVASLAVAEAVASSGVELPHSDVSWAFPRPDSTEIEHPLVDTWATRPLDAARMLGAARVQFSVPPVRAPEPTTLLGRIQADVRAGVLGTEPCAVTPDDRSVQIHSAPGPTRQVEVLRDALLGLLRDTPSLRESDIAIVCPALDVYGPVISAVFGPSADRGEQPTPGETPRLRYTVVDRSARGFNPVLDAMARILALMTSRFDVPSVRDVLGLPAVRERFGLTADDLSLVSDLVDRAGVRWGLNGEHRVRWGLPADFERNSWAAGLDQLMLGVAVGDDLRTATLPGATASDDRSAEHQLALGGVAPMPLDDGALAGAGRVAAALRSLQGAYEVLVVQGPRPVSEWCRSVLGVANQLVASAWGEDWQLAKFTAAVESLEVASRSADQQPSGAVFGFTEFRRLLAPSLEGPAARADMGFGTVVVARPHVIANVPFRVVAVLGLDEDALPSARSGGDDLLASHQSVGDRDIRADARADLLSAVMAARDHLVVTCSSRNVRTNAEVPHAVVLDEFLEVLARTTGCEVAELAAIGVVRDHPRQSFAASNFLGGPDEPAFCFDPVSRDGAAALRSAVHQDPDDSGTGFILVPEFLLELDRAELDLSLTDIKRFYEHPVRYFFQNQLNVVVPERAEARPDGLPITVSGLDRAALASVMFDGGLRGAVVSTGELLTEPTVDAALKLYEARGALPPPELLHDVVAEMAIEVLELLQFARSARVDSPPDPPIAVTVSIPGSLSGSISGTIANRVAGTNPALVLVSTSKSKPARRLGLLLDLLLLNASGHIPEDARADRAVYLSRASKTPKEPDDRRAEGEEWTFTVDSDTRRAACVAVLSSIVSQFRRGNCAALPLFAATSFLLQTDRDNASSVWSTTNFSPFDQEDLDPYHVAAFGRRSYEDMTAIEICMPKDGAAAD